MKHLFCIALSLATGSLALTDCSGGATTFHQQVLPQSWRVQVGAASADQALQGLAFYPSSTLTIDAGDSVTWSFPSGEPHTVALLGTGQTAPPPPTDPNTSKPAGGTSYDGTTFTSSGFKLLGASYSLRFTKAGTYAVYCLIHQPEMVQTIVVQNAGDAYPHPQSFYDTAGSTALGNDLAAATASLTTFPFGVGSLHLVAGIAPGSPSGTPSTATVLRFLATTDVSNQTTTVTAGSTVTWTNYSNNEPHTVTFAPFGQPFPKLNPFGPPTGGNTYDGTTLVSSGPLFPGQSFSITFPTAGSFVYHCLFHDDTENMVSTLVVK